MKPNLYRSFSLAALIMLFSACTKPESNAIASEKSKPNILFILIDTLRSDHLGYMGYARDTSPRIDELARKSIQFTSAYAASSWTAPSVASIFSGMPPSLHGMMPPNSRVKAADKFSFKLSADITTMAESMKALGYKTAGVSSNEWISEKFGYTQGFDYFFMKSRLDGNKVNEKAFRVIDKLFDPAQPFFLYVHYIDPHDPYEAPEPFTTFFKDSPSDSRYGPVEQETLRAYDNEIRFVDAKVGELIDYAKSKGLLDNTYIILTSDHGEQFMERGQPGHGNSLHDEETHIPLFIIRPDGTTAKISTPVSHIDLYPTLVKIAGGAKPEGLTGIDILDTSNLTRAHGVFSEVARKQNFKALIGPDNKKIIAEYDILHGLYAAPGTEIAMKVFDLSADPLELSPVDILTLHKEQLYKDYIGVYENFSKNFTRYKIDTMEMSEETFEELKTLGYF